jgi:hypothetical protein
VGLLASVVFYRETRASGVVVSSLVIMGIFATKRYKISYSKIEQFKQISSKPSLHALKT